VIRRSPAPLPWLAALLVVYLSAPFLAAVPQLGRTDWQTVNTAELWRAVAVSLGSATVAVTLIFIGGVPLGYCLARIPGRKTALVGFIVQLPLAIPPLASGILLLFLLGPYTPLGQLGHGALTDSFIGIVLAETFVAAPFLIIASRSAFASVDPVLEDVAATLGRGKLETFLKVSLPLAWPGIRAGLLLSWLRAFGEFGATVMVAYHPYSLPVYTYVAFGSQGLPAMMPVLLPALAAAVAVFALSTIRVRPRSRHASIALGQPGKLVSDRTDAQTTSAISATPGPASGLSFEFHRALGTFGLNVSWTTQARRLAILGPSGSGKTLTLRLLAGLDKPDTGTFTLGKGELTTLPPEARGVAYVPQNYGLFPHMDVDSQLLFPVGADPLAARRWIERLGLSSLENRLPATLSLGQQQRVALARALVRPADLILLDEPFSALDAPLRRRLREEMRQLQREITATMVIVTHDPDEAALLGDEILLLDRGRVLQSGKTEAVFARPASETVARLLGAENVGFGIAVDDEHIEMGNGTKLLVKGPSLPRNERVGWSVRPEHIQITEDGAYEAIVEDVTPFGGRFRLSVRIDDTRLLVLSAQPVDQTKALCRFDIDPRSVQVWKAE
jgi:ABC-type Fe3+/spermidine/putrescine transport system ATPase subunit/ABC-type sulfate transport system permease component